MKETASVQQHYGTSPLRETVIRALAGANLGEGEIPPSALAPLDQFHVRGLAATNEIAAGLDLTPESTVLDVGCGLGGPARFLAARYGCTVTGIDLSEPFIDVARLLAERTGLSHRLTFVQGDALHLPFADSSFESAWTQHVSMNIADKAAFYREVYRVLEPGGSFAIYDIVQGNGEPPHFPVPWARTPEISFLVTANAMRETLRDAGFTETRWTDTTAQALEWLSAFRSSSTADTALSLASVMGSGFGEMAANLGRNLMEGKLCVVQAVVRRE